ncbi:MAG: hypothetical protein PHD21_01135 [Flavobacteriales bacterium]|nr:hypothetical protein [Flavobacteriales bacterium]
MRNFIFILLPVLALVGCKNTQKAQDEEPEKADVTITGADTDEHGCKGSAGYTWSEVSGECIRLWESGVQMLPVETDSSTAVLAAYAVFAQDSSRVELFLPDVEQNEYSILEKRTLPNGSSVWNVEDDDTYSLKKDEKGRWSISRRMKVLFVQK